MTRKIFRSGHGHFIPPISLRNYPKITTETLADTTSFLTNLSSVTRFLKNLSSVTRFIIHWTTTILILYCLCAYVIMERTLLPVHIFFSENFYWFRLKSVPASIWNFVGIIKLCFMCIQCSCILDRSLNGTCVFSEKSHLMKNLKSFSIGLILYKNRTRARSLQAVVVWLPFLTMGLHINLQILLARIEQQGHYVCWMSE